MGMKSFAKLLLILAVTPLLLLVLMLLIPVLLLLMFLFSVFAQRSWTGGFNWHSSSTRPKHPNFQSSASGFRGDRAEEEEESAGEIIDVEARSVEQVLLNGQPEEGMHGQTPSAGAATGAEQPGRNR